MSGVDASRSATGKIMLSRDDWMVRGLLVLYAGFFLVALVVPLYLMVSRSFKDSAGNFIGLDNYLLYFQTPAVSHSISHSFFVAAVSTTIGIAGAFVYAYALTRTCMRFKGFFKIMAMVPLLSP